MNDITSDSDIELANPTGITNWGHSAPVYHGLYEGIPANVASWIEQDIKQVTALTHKKDITILDYGCGTGRYFPLYQAIAKKEGLNIHCLAFDPVLGQLNQCEELLGKLNFIQVDPHYSTSLACRFRQIEEKQCTAGFRGPKYAKKAGKGSLTVELIHGNIFKNLGSVYNPDYLQNTLFSKDHIDYGLCLFGVLSYVMGDRNRVAMLQTLGNIVEGPMRVSIPTQNRDKKLYDKFERLRELREEAIENCDPIQIARMERKIGDAKEHGETITPFAAEGGKTTLHPYYYTKNTNEFKALLERAGFTDYTISASNICSETFITDKNQPFRNIADALDSATLDETGMDKQAMFLMAKIQGKKALDAGSPPITAVDPETLPYTVIQGPYSRQAINTPKPTAKAI